MHFAAIKSIRVQQQSGNNGQCIFLCVENSFIKDLRSNLTYKNKYYNENCLSMQDASTRETTEKSRNRLLLKSDSKCGINQSLELWVDTYFKMNINS